MQLYEILDIVHGYWAYLVLLVLLLATVNAIVKYFSGQPFGAKDFRISLFALIATHIQVLLGLILYFAHPFLGFSSITTSGMSAVMKNAEMRLFAVEHPLIMIIAVIFITIGYSRHKKQLTSKGKFKSLSIFYFIALLLILSRIPWHHWLFEQ